MRLANYFKNQPNLLVPLSIFSAIAFWIVDALVDSYLFSNEPFLESLYPDGMEIYMRILIALQIIGFGYLAAHLIRSQLRLSLMENESQFHAVISASLDGFCMTDHQGRLQEVNDAYCKLLGYSREELLLMHISDVEAVERPEDTACHIKKIVDEGGDLFETKHRHKNGSILELEVNVVYTKVGQGFFYAFFRDITQRKADNLELRSLKNRLEFLLNTSPAVLYSCRASGDYGATFVSANVVDILGYQPQDFLGDSEFWSKHIHPDDRAGILDGVEEAYKQDSYQHEYRFMHQNGTYRWMHDELKVIRNKQGQPIELIGYWSDITDRKHYQQELERQARIDFLTQVYTRGYFMEQAELELNRAIRYESPLSILMLDIDLFKQINDVHGHKAGDKVLLQLALISRQALREVDLIGRIGGEEFAILLPETEKAEAAEVADRLREALRMAKVPLESGGLPIQFTVSIGVASLASKDDNIDVLLNLADKALYEAKNSGRNKVCVS